MELTLSEKSYLAECITKLCPELNDKSYKIASHFTRPQRTKFLGHYNRREDIEAKDMISNIKALQAHII